MEGKVQIDDFKVVAFVLGEEGILIEESIHGHFGLVKQLVQSRVVGSEQISKI